MSRLHGFLLAVVIASAIAACNRLPLTRSESATGDAPAKRTVVVAGKRAYLFDCLKEKGASRKDECDVTAHRSDLHRSGSGDPFVWSLLALLASDPGFAALICSELEVETCYGLFGITRRDITHYPPHRCDVSWFWRDDFGQGNRSGCGWWGWPGDDGDGDPGGSGVTLYGFDETGAYRSCTPPPPDDPAICTMAMTVWHQQWRDECAIWGGVVQSCRCLDLCTIYAAPVR